MKEGGSLMNAKRRCSAKTRFLLFGALIGILFFVPNWLPSPVYSQSNKKMIKGTGKKISIELKNIDIIEVLKLLAQKGNINIVAGKEVRGRVTLFLEDVEIWDALRIIFEANNLAYVWDGEILKVITEREYEQIYGQKFHDLREVKVFNLKHAKAGEAANSINQLKSQLGKVVTDDRTNSLIVIDVPETLEIIAEAIKTIDVKMTTKVFPLRFATPGAIEETAKSILSKNGILQTDNQSNKIIVTDIPENVDKLEHIINEYDVAPYTITKIFPLKFARYDEIESKLKEEITEDLGVVRADERTNTIIITDLPSKVARMEKIIEAYDEKTREVLIDAKVVQVTLSDAFELGIDWELVLETFRGRNINFSLVNATSNILGAPAGPLNSFISSGVGFPTSVQTVTVTQTATATTATGTAATGTAATATAATTPATAITSTGTGGTTTFTPQPGTIPFDLNTIRAPFTFPRVGQGGTVVATGTLFGSDAFSSALNALKQVGKVNLLSSPRITAISGEEAKIAVATREAFVTNTVVQNDTVATTAENVTFIDVGVILSVTPTINPDYFVNMKIRPEVSAVVRTLTTAEGNVIPIVSTQEAESTVLIRDGVTVILGGLITDSRVRRDSRIPVFGSMPIIGPLFRNTSYSLVKDEIVIFLTPHINSGDTDYEGSWAASQGVEKYLEEEEKSRATEEDVVMPNVEKDKEKVKKMRKELEMLKEKMKQTELYYEEEVPIEPVTPLLPPALSSNQTEAEEVILEEKKPQVTIPNPRVSQSAPADEEEEDKLVRFYSF